MIGHMILKTMNCKSNRGLRLFAAACVALLGLPVRANVGDPTIRTNHPHYPGEGAFQTVEDCVTFATLGKETNQDKAIALYLWMLKHQWHLLSPQDCPTSWRPNDTRSHREESLVWDANRARFSFGYGLCGTVHAWNEPYWKALGMNARRRAFPGHTNSEVFYDGSWHAFDTDMAGLIFRKDGTVAGYEDVMNDPSCATRYQPPLPHYPFAWPSDEQTMRRGWAEVARGGNWFKMYNTGFAAHPAVIHLRPGESFTRTLDPDGFGGPNRRRFWHIARNGPTRNWAFLDEETPWHRGPQSNALGNASFGNGVFEYRPDLSRPTWRQGLMGKPDQIGWDSKLGQCIAKHQGASMTFGHSSPYVICGDPKDDTDPMLGTATDGFLVEGQTKGEWRLEVSVDQGQTWKRHQMVSGEFRLDWTDLVKGHYGWWLRLTGAENARLERLRFVTTTQISQAMYPRLKPSGCDLVFRRANRAAVPLLPNLGGPETDFSNMEIRSLRSANLTYQPMGGQGPAGFHSRGNRPAQVVFRLESPTDLMEISAAARFKVRVPPPAGCDFHLDYSLNEGKSWTQFGKVTVPEDNELSHGWVSGKAQWETKGVKSAWIRVHLDGGGYPTSLFAFQAYGLRKTEEPSPVVITQEWEEKGRLRSHTERISEQSEIHRYTIPTGDRIVDKKIRIESP